MLDEKTKISRAGGQGVSKWEEKHDSAIGVGHLFWVTVLLKVKNDAMDRRIEKVDAVAETVTRYYDDDQRVVLVTDYDSSGPSESDLRYFIYGNYIDEVLMMRDIDSSEDYYYGHDHLYSTAVLFNDLGNIVERYEYDAYGKTTILNSQFSILNSSQYGNPYTFTGRRLDLLDDGDLKLMYYRARTYDMETGRFMQRDPLGVNPAGGKQNPFKTTQQYLDGMSLYQYVKSNPVIYIDLVGLSAKPATSPQGTCKMTEKTNLDHDYWWPTIQDEHHRQNPNVPSSSERLAQFLGKPCPSGLSRFSHVRYSNNMGNPGGGMQGMWDVNVWTWCAKCEGCCPRNIFGDSTKCGKAQRSRYNHVIDLDLEEPGLQPGETITEHVDYCTCRTYD